VVVAPAGRAIARAAGPAVARAAGPAVARAAGPAIALVVALVVALAVAVAGCGSSHGLPRIGATPGLAALVRERRPLGRGPRFHPPARGSVPGRCRRALGPRYGVHVELFAANRVVLVAPGIGVRGPVHGISGRIAGARCYGALVTLDPTGVILVRPGRTLRVADLFRAWGEPLSRRRLASFTASGRHQVVTYVGGRRRRGAPGSLPLTRHAEIVLEVGPPVPPHAGYTFPPGS
jgi:hypothetical protein